MPSIRNLTPEIDIGRVDQGDGDHIVGGYETPYPIDGQYFLVSRNGTILLRDYAGKSEVVVLKPLDGMGFYSPRPIRPRPVCRILPSRLPQKDETESWATVYLQDVYQGLEPHVVRGRVKQICVIEEVPRSDPRMSKVRFGVAHD